MTSTDCMNEDITAVDIPGDTEPGILFLLGIFSWKFVTGIVQWVKDYFFPP